MYDLLLQLDPVKWDTIIPDLATSWKISDDELTYTFFIREGVKFHDGAPLTAADVVASFNHIIFPPEGVLSPRRTLFAAVNEVVATDDMTVEFRLDEPRGFLLKGISTAFNVILREQSLEDNNYDLRRIPDYPGTGPFRFKDIEPGVVWRMEKNPDYYNPDLPYLDDIDAFHFGFGPATGAACLANVIDFCNFIDIISAEKAEDIPDLNTANLFSTGAAGLYINNTRPPFDDARVRKAMHLVLNKDALREAVWEQNTFVATSWVLHTDPFFAEYWATLQNEPGWRTPTEDDKAEARALMKEAGYEDGIKDVDFAPRDISFLVAWAEPIQDILKRELKIETNIRIVASGAWLEEAQRGTFDLATMGFSAGLPHVAVYWNSVHGTTGGNNWNKYSNPEFDALVAETAGEADPEKLKVLINKGIEILDRDVPWVQLGGGLSTLGWWDYLHVGGLKTRGGSYEHGMKNEIWWLDR